MTSRICTHCRYTLGDINPNVCPECGRDWRRPPPTPAQRIRYAGPIVSFFILGIVSITNGYFVFVGSNPASMIDFFRWDVIRPLMFGAVCLTFSAVFLFMKEKPRRIFADWLHLPVFAGIVYFWMLLVL